MGEAVRAGVMHQSNDHRAGRGDPRRELWRAARIRVRRTPPECAVHITHTRTGVNMSTHDTYRRTVATQASYGRVRRARLPPAADYPSYPFLSRGKDKSGRLMCLRVVPKKKCLFYLLLMRELLHVSCYINELVYQWYNNTVGGSTGNDHEPIAISSFSEPNPVDQSLIETNIPAPVPTLHTETTGSHEELVRKNDLRGKMVQTEVFEARRSARLALKEDQPMWT